MIKKEIKELFVYMSWHHEDLEKSITDDLKEKSSKEFLDCWDEYMSVA